MKLMSAIIISLISVIAQHALEIRDDDLVHHMTWLEEQSLEEGDIPLDAFGRLDFANQVTECQNLTERGEYAEAAAIYASMLEQDMNSDWRSMLVRRLQILRKWIDSESIEPPDYREFFVETGPTWFRNRARPIVTLWKLECRDEAEKYELLKDLLAARGDQVGVQLVLEQLTRIGTNEQAAKALLEIGNQHHRAEEVDEAAIAWTRIKNEYPQTASWAEAVFNLGLLNKSRGDYEIAVEYFAELRDVNVLEPRGHVMAPLGNYQSRAQWEIGNCRFAQESYSDALDAYQLAESKFPVRSTCGIGHAEYRHRNALYQGLCHDWLGEPRLAVRCYFLAVDEAHGLCSDSVASLRIADMYESIDGLADLEQLLDSIGGQSLSSSIRLQKYLVTLDTRAINEFARQFGTNGRRPIETDHVDERYVTLRRVLSLRTMGEGGKWDSLISLLMNKSSVAAPEDAVGRGANWEVVEAARILAAHSTEATPRIIARFPAANFSERRWLCYGLGRCGNNEALAFLKEVALKDSDYHQRKSAVFALGIAGREGENVLEELAQSTNTQLVDMIKRDGILKQHRKIEELRFPKLKQSTTLPKTFDELLRG